MAIVWGFTFGYGPGRVVELEVALPRLPACADGYTAYVATDLHIGSMAGPAFASAVVAQANSYEPDAIFVIGDVVDLPIEVTGFSVDPLADFAPRTDGVYFTSGNHEVHSSTRDAWVSYFHAHLGFHVLDNNRTRLGATDECRGFVLAGITDPEDVPPPSLAAALQGFDRTDALVLAAHRPSQADEEDVAERGVGLQLSGHTHGLAVWPAHLFTLLEEWPHFAGMRYEDADKAKCYDAEQLAEKVAEREEEEAEERREAEEHGRVFSGDNDDEDHEALYLRGSPECEADYDHDGRRDGTWVYTSEGAASWGPRIRFLSFAERTFVTLRSPEVVGDAIDFNNSGDLMAMRWAMFWALSTLVLLPCAVLIGMGAAIPTAGWRAVRWAWVTRHRRHYEAVLAKADADGAEGFGGGGGGGGDATRG